MGVVVEDQNMLINEACGRGFIIKYVVGCFVLKYPGIPGTWHMYLLCKPLPGIIWLSRWGNWPAKHLPLLQVFSRLVVGCSLTYVLATHSFQQLHDKKS